ncbi:DUF998 domain-containing protein [Alkalimarinus alittae]|uniref:DUF998 domain-containing protein n=1 Tax=Alkalimarinus alittae TaxID=2961619 RepID=A0ABY6N3Q5_9ALTE|nr:DUF998 domain-containing protein [Alkalimarinus alittae]UZE96619.1 DUF998 domain-containing protein [Alkalimarinus alittae]
MTELLGLLGVVISLFAFIAPVYYAKKSDGYSTRLNTLSELGATGSRYQKAVSRYYFLPLGVAIILFLVLSQATVTFLTQSYLAWALLGLVGVGYLVAALFPCDPGSPIGGTASNKLHNTAGVLEYLGAGLGLILMGVSPEQPVMLPQMNLYLILSGSVILLSLMMLILPSFYRIRGLVQRFAEASFFIWMMTVSLLLLLIDR